MLDETKLKNKISAVMGHNFVDAIFEGTTSETLETKLLQAMSSIAERCEENGWVDITVARRILEAYNPDRRYNGNIFEGYAKEGIKRAIKELEK